MVQRAAQRGVYDDLSTGDMAEELMSHVRTGSEEKDVCANNFCSRRLSLMT